MPKIQAKKPPPLSEIIAVKDEAENLRRFFHLLFRQKYEAEYEVIAVLDRCTDDSKNILRTFAEKEPRLRIIEVNEIPFGVSPKKFALRTGIEHALYDSFVFTDADCAVSEGRLTAIGACFTEGADVVFGYAPYFSKPTALNAFIQFETIQTAFFYLGFAKQGIPYMAVGRNMAYNRRFFEHTDIFSEHYSESSGSDDIPINRYAKKFRLGFALNTESWVYSPPKETFKQWINQKLRHVGASRYYTRQTRLLIGAGTLLHIGFYLSFGALFVVVEAIYTGALAFVYYLITGGIYFFIFKRFLQLKLFVWFPILDFFYFLYCLVLVPLALFIKPKWKN